VFRARSLSLCVLHSDRLRPHGDRPGPVEPCPTRNSAKPPEISGFRQVTRASAMSFSTSAFAPGTRFQRRPTSTSRTAPALNSSVKLRRVRFGFLSDIVEIVFAFRKVSTKPGQVHDLPARLWNSRTRGARHEKHPRPTRRELPRSSAAMMFAASVFTSGATSLNSLRPGS
jgi:hypothetical protein